MLHFKDGKFKIMQIADIQEDMPVNPDTVKLISLALDREKPDLVVLTGDQIQGYSGCYLKDGEKKVKECIRTFIAPIKERNIPFCLTFGNHDDDGGVSKKIQIDTYTEFENCVLGTPRSEDDLGTYSLQIFDSNKTKEIFNLYLIDSNKKEKDGAYSPVKKEQIQWYKDERDALKEKTGDYLPAFVFQHIPVPEFYDVLIKCKRKERGSVEAFKSRKNTFWKLSNEAKEKGYFMGESPAVPEINNGEFEAMKEKGDVLGIFVGHDHINSFLINKDGIDLAYCQGAGFNTYGPGGKRGVRIYTLNENDIRNYEAYTVTMEELCDFKPSKPVKEFVFTHMPSSINDAISLAKKVGIVTGVAVAAYIAAKALIN